MLDNKGSFYIIDAFLALVLVLIVFLAVNAVITAPAHVYSYENKNIRTAQDVMELLSGKIGFQDQTFLGGISSILKENKNSRESIRQVSQICESKLNSYDVKNYMFCENNMLKGEVLASKGDYSKADDVSVATRTYGDYSFTLSIW